MQVCHLWKERQNRRQGVWEEEPRGRSEKLGPAVQRFPPRSPWAATAGAALDHHGLGSKAESGLGCAAGALRAANRHILFIEGSAEQHTLADDAWTLKAILSSLGTPQGQRPGTSFLPSLTRKRVFTRCTREV